MARPPLAAKRVWLAVGWAASVVVFFVFFPPYDCALSGFRASEQVSSRSGPLVDLFSLDIGGWRGSETGQSQMRDNGDRRRRH